MYVIERWFWRFEISFFEPSESQVDVLSPKLSIGVPVSVIKAIFVPIDGESQ